MAILDKITVAGFKSIRSLEGFKLRNLNVLIGANGAGKSNFIGLFELLSALMAKRLQLFAQEHDGPDAILFGGRKKTPVLHVELFFGSNAYEIELKPAGQRLIFQTENTKFFSFPYHLPHFLGTAHQEALLPDISDTFTLFAQEALASWHIYHFHDTSTSAAVRQAGAVRDNLLLKPDAGNLAAFLRRLRQSHQKEYDQIVATLRLVAPFFGDFVYRDESGELIELEWTQADDPDTVLGPRQLSDGTLRFICLATLLLQPAKLRPDTILIDEPELGLHPYAVAILATLLRQASGGGKQLIVSTQSVELVNELSPQDVIVVDRKDGASVFERLDAERLKDWLEDYALGELWKMNVLGGRPSR